MTPRQLADAVRTNFEQLIREHKLRIVATTNRAPEVSVTLENASTRISISLEIGGVPWLKISRLERQGAHVVPGDGYDLLFLLDERAPDEAEKLRGLTEHDAHAAIRLLADYLSRFGGDLLAGDFGVFAVLERKSIVT